MYEPNIGRWTVEDPLGFAAGDPNFYRAFGNDPSNATDPTGLVDKPVIVKMTIGDIIDEFPTRTDEEKAKLDNFLKYLVQAQMVNPKDKTVRAKNFLVKVGSVNNHTYGAVIYGVKFKCDTTANIVQGVRQVIKYNGKVIADLQRVEAWKVKDKLSASIDKHYVFSYELAGDFKEKSYEVTLEVGSGTYKPFAGDAHVWDDGKIDDIKWTDPAKVLKYKFLFTYDANGQYTFVGPEGMKETNVKGK